MGRHSVVEVITGAVVLVVAALFLAYAVSRSGTAIGSGYTLYANFAHVDGLNIGADVQIAGVKVGTVTEERLNPKTFEAVVAMSIDNGVQLPKDTGASIFDASLLGGKYVSLSPGGDTANLQPGQTISATQSSISLEDLLGKFIFSVTSLNNGKSGNSGGGSSSDSGQGSTGGSSGGNGGGLPPLGK